VVSDRDRDFHQPEEAARLANLVREADVLIDGFR
jgi:hypothetical protein